MFQQLLKEQGSSVLFVIFLELKKGALVRDMIRACFVLLCQYIVTYTVTSHICECAKEDLDSFLLLQNMHRAQYRYLCHMLIFRSK